MPTNLPADQYFHIHPTSAGRYIAPMTELLAALLGAIVGGILSAWIGARQTAKVLKHETDLAAAERREAARLDEERRRAKAADHLIAALAEFVTVSRDDRGNAAAFVRVPTTADVHRERKGRVSALLKAGSSCSHALPTDLRGRWDALTWMVRFNQTDQPERSEDLRRRDANDLLNYIEYVRRSLCAVSGEGQIPPNFPAPNVRREGSRPWGFKPDGSSSEPDLTEWHLSARLIGKVNFSTGGAAWYGPNGLVEDLPEESTESVPSDRPTDFSDPGR